LAIPAKNSECVKVDLFENSVDCGKVRYSRLVKFRVNDKPNSYY